MSEIENLPSLQSVKKKKRIAVSFLIGPFLFLILISARVCIIHCFKFLSTKNIDPADPNAVVSADMDNFCDCRLPLLLSVSIRFPGFAFFEVEMFGRDEREGGASSSCVREKCRRTLLARKRRFQREFVDRSEGEAKISLVSVKLFFKN